MRKTLLTYKGIPIQKGKMNMSVTNADKAHGKVTLAITANLYFSIAEYNSLDVTY